MMIRDGVERLPTESTEENRLEDAYWEFDAIKKKINGHTIDYSERDAFKKAIRLHFPHLF